jgi:hypothetical protein
MEQFYTKQVSKEIFKALLNKEYPVENIPVGYFASADGVGYVEHGQKIPTYTEVLDWLIEKGVKISIGVPKDRKEWFTITDKSTKLISTDSFTKTMDQTILFVLEFI